MQKNKCLFVVLAMLMLFSWAFSATAQDTTTGTFIAYVSNETGNDDIFLMSQTGQILDNLTESRARDWNPSWSPDGAKIIFNSDRDGANQIYTMTQGGTDVTPLFPSSQFDDIAPTWSPDGQWIAFVSDRAGAGRDVYIVPASGGEPTRLTDNKRIKGDPTWSPDSQLIAYWEIESEGDSQIYTVAIADKRITRLTTDFNNGVPVWSPSGDFIYFDTDRDQYWSLYKALPNGDSPQRVPTEGLTGGLGPIDFNSGRLTLSPDGNTLVFVSDRDENDELYMVNTDGTGLVRLSDDSFSTHSPAWQPRVPQGQTAVPQTATTTEAPAEVASTESLVDTGVNQSFNGVNVVALPIETILQRYDISSWHTVGWKGAGQRVGVIDTEFVGISNLEQKYNIDVNIPPDESIANYNSEQGSHGTDVLHIVHLVAPEASLYACRYDGTLPKLEACTDWMSKNDVKIINHSVGLPVLPINGQGQWANLAGNVVSEGVLWVNSAGNFASGTVNFPYTDTAPEDGVVEFSSGTRTFDRLTVNLGAEAYTGNVMLSWMVDDAFGDYGGFGIVPDFSIQILDASGNVLTNGVQGIDRPQATDPNVPASERLSLTNVPSPFGIRVKLNNLADFEGFVPPIQMLLFVEYASIVENVTGGTSVLSPGDEYTVLTVGSLNGNGELSGYSSNGSITGVYTSADGLAPSNTRVYQKPNISTVGEIVLPPLTEGGESTTFVGTSAASPVVAGAAALILQQYNVDTSILYNKILQNFMIPQTDPRYGGILQLSKPESNPPVGGTEVNVPARTVWPQTDALNARDEIYFCPGAVTTRFEVGLQGYVNYNLGLAMRDEPSGNILTQLYLGEPFTVIGGPRCLSALTWWQIELADGSQGWVGEGDAYYLVTPSDFSRAELAKEYVVDCPAAPTQKLTIGDTAVVVNEPAGGVSFYRDEEGTKLISGVENGSIVRILGGPVCGGRNNNVLRWYVRIVDGQWAGNEGWLAEGITGDRFLELER